MSIFLPAFYFTLPCFSSSNLRYYLMISFAYLMIPTFLHQNISFSGQRFLCSVCCSISSNRHVIYICRMNNMLGMADTRWSQVCKNLTRALPAAHGESLDPWGDFPAVPLSQMGAKPYRLFLGRCQRSPPSSHFSRSCSWSIRWWDCMQLRRGYFPRFLEWQKVLILWSAQGFLTGQHVQCNLNHKTEHTVGTQLMICRWTD